MIIHRSSSSFSAVAPKDQLGSSPCGTSRLRDFHSIELRPADFHKCRSVIYERLLRASQRLRLRLRRFPRPPASALVSQVPAGGHQRQCVYAKVVIPSVPLKTKRCRSAVSYSAALHNCQLTDPVYLLQSGKTLDILRFAPEIQRLAFRLPRLPRPLRGLRPHPPAPRQAD